METEPNNEGGKFNATLQKAIEKAKALPKALYGSEVDNMRSFTSVDGISITKDEGNREYDVSATKESYLGDESGDVRVNFDVSTGANPFISLKI